MSDNSEYITTAAWHFVGKHVKVIIHNDFMVHNGVLLKLEPGVFQCNYVNFRQQDVEKIDQHTNTIFVRRHGS